MVQEIHDLWDDNSTKGLLFKKYSRRLNNALDLSSFCAKETSISSSWNPTFTVRGTPYMCIGTLFPAMNEIPKFAQIYVHDPKNSENMSHIRLNHMMLPRNLNE